jgi:hypothetical protein
MLNRSLASLAAVALCLTACSNKSTPSPDEGSEKCGYGLSMSGSNVGAIAPILGVTRRRDML